MRRTEHLVPCAVVEVAATAGTVARADSELPVSSSLSVSVKASVAGLGCEVVPEDADSDGEAVRFSVSSDSDPVDCSESLEAELKALLDFFLVADDVDFDVDDLLRDANFDAVGPIALENRLSPTKIAYPSSSVFSDLTPNCQYCIFDLPEYTSSLHAK